MRSRVTLHWINFRNSQKQFLSRTFANSTPLQSKLARPQLPFLSIPIQSRQTHRVRYLTTERKQWMKHEIKQGFKFVVLFYITAASVAAASWAINQETLERQYPTPHEWRILTRIYFRNAKEVRDQNGGNIPWTKVMELAELAVKRLEDPEVDGNGVRDAPPGSPPRTKDVSDKPEAWRRGYFDAMMLYAATAQILVGWVRDKSRDIFFPPEVVIGPSNPHPKPISPGSASAPREEDCEIAYCSPGDIYLRIMSTVGLTNRQRMDAALAYASWLEFNGLAGPASIMYERAVELALGNPSSSTSSPIERKTWVLKDSSTPPTSNLLTSLTALATFRARHGNTSTAIPILVSILKARRSLRNAEAQPQSASGLTGTASSWPSVQKITTSLLNLIQPPAYPPPPSDGNQPPIRDSKAMCEEAALHLHIGEIMYSSQKVSREEGLAWTRDAVDIAEEQLHKPGTDRDARATCRECLEVGLSNWIAMVSRLAREEVEQKERVQHSNSSWFGLWREGKPEDLGRWAAELKVIRERERRASELLEDLEPVKTGMLSISSIFKA